jgi:hypothetical protein
MGNACGNYETVNFNYSSLKNRNWMELMKADIKSTKLIDLIIPGSHDSGSCGINDKEWGSTIYITQKVPIFDQLLIGARFLDLRYGPGSTWDAQDVKVMHQMFKGEYLKDILSKINEFLNQNPKEFIIINFQEERKISAPQKEWILSEFPRLFGDRLILQSDKETWFNLRTVTMGQIFSHKKNILLLTCRKFEA